ncbi:RluA family pseudouridine synthase [Lentibacillus persicus]|uniref:RluA family pseudouridine synthase n=1 Tax=Lentibacillus persicus TaxID=640948 RepID=UPI000B7E9CBD
MNIIKKGEWAELLIPPKWNTYTIESLLQKNWQVPKKLRHELRMRKGIKLNGDIVPWDSKLISGQKLQVHMFPKEDYGLNPTFLDVDILYEDNHILIANKIAGMDTHPNTPDEVNTLANGVAFHLLTEGIETKPRHIHRLDHNTTGAVIFAKHALASSMMSRLLEKRKIQRTYLALVHGKLKYSKGTINKPIGRDRHHQTRRHISKSGQSARTNYETLFYNPKDNTSLVKLELDTGRTHQIRVHMSYMGNPLLGDTLYGGEENKRQVLHAAKISMVHPLTEEYIECIAPFNDDPPLFNYDLTRLYY